MITADTSENNPKENHPSSTIATQTQPLPVTFTKTPTIWTGWRLLVWDAILIGGAFLLSYHLRYTIQLFQPVDEFNQSPFRPYIPYALVFIGWILFSCYNAGLYLNQRGRAWTSEAFTITNAATNAGVLIMAISFLLQPLVFSRLLIVQSVILTILILAIWRLILRDINARLRKRGIGVERVLVIGAAESGLNVLRTLVARPDLGYRAIGFLDDHPERGTTDLGRVTALGEIKNLPEVIEREQIDVVIITLPWEQHEQINMIVESCEQKHITVRTVPDLFQFNLSQVKVEMLAGIPLLGIRKDINLNPANRLVKRIVDITLVILSLPISLPIIGMIALAIRLDSKGAPFFAQTRIGLNGKPFKVIKFRTMIKNAEAMWDKVIRESQVVQDPRLPKLENDPRVTRIGKFLRRSSLDEIPNIFNVLLGDMSLIGPRPQVPREVKLYAPWQYQRLKVKPGMTGLWQISGRSNVPFDEMCLMDIYYIENWSLTLDLQILLQTLPKVIFRRGAY